MVTYQTPQIVFLDAVPYQEALDIQKEAHHRAVLDPNEETILVLQHPPTITLGKRGDRGYIKDEKEIEKLGAKVFATERGGEVTAHMPGQLVVYPILHLGKRCMSVRQYVHLLESAVIDVLAHWNISASRHPQFPGVWVGERKICALGVRVSKRVSMHGIALNITNDLSLFDSIVPCGIQDYGVCRIIDLTDQVVLFQEVAECWVRIFTRTLSGSARR